MNEKKDVLIIFIALSILSNKAICERSGNERREFEEKKLRILELPSFKFFSSTRFIDSCFLDHGFLWAGMFHRFPETIGADVAIGLYDFLTLGSGFHVSWLFDMKDSYAGPTLLLNLAFYKWGWGTVGLGYRGQVGRRLSDGKYAGFFNYLEILLSLRHSIFQVTTGPALYMEDEKFSPVGISPLIGFSIVIDVRVPIKKRHSFVFSIRFSALFFDLESAESTEFGPILPFWPTGGLHLGYLGKVFSLSPNSSR